MTTESAPEIRLQADKPIEPYAASVEGVSGSAGGCGNVVLVRAVAHYDPARAPHVPVDGDEMEWAADYFDRQLVQVDTNYKATRPGVAAVDLTRPDAVHLASMVLAAVEDTFHCQRVGELRATEAAELLRALGEVEHALFELREHALEDLLRRVGLEEA